MLGAKGQSTHLRHDWRGHARLLRDGEASRRRRRRADEQARTGGKESKHYMCFLDGSSASLAETGQEIAFQALSCSC